MKNIRKCIVCGKEYEYCTGCRKPNQPTWLTIYHDENCRNIWHAITTVYDEKGAAAAAKILSDLDLSDMDNFRDDVKDKIEKIFDEPFDDDRHVDIVEVENDDEEVANDDDFESFEEE